LRSVPRKSTQVQSLRCSSLRLVSSMRCSATSVFTCTGLNRPTRVICAIPAPSLRSGLVDLLRRQQSFMCRVSTPDHGKPATVKAVTSHCDSGPALDPDPAKAHAERGQNSDDIGRLGPYFPAQDHLAHRTTHTDLSSPTHQTHEMRHLIAPSSMLEVEPTPTHSSSQMGMRTSIQG